MKFRPCDKFLNYLSVSQVKNNPALKLKQSVIEAAAKKHHLDLDRNDNIDSNVVARDVADVNDLVEGDDQSKLKWMFFDEDAYIAKTKLKPGDDAYQRHKFNQAASDALKSNRDIPDSRHSK